MIDYNLSGSKILEMVWTALTLLVRNEALASKPVYILGTGLSHDGSSCLLRDGYYYVLSSAAEEASPGCAPA